MDPATWIYLALLAASTAASYAGQKKTERAQNRVLADERVRREKLQSQSDAAAQDTANKLTQLKDKEAARATELAELYKTEAPAAQTDVSGTRFLDVLAPTGSTATIEATKDQLAKATARANQTGTARGALGSFGDVMTQGMLDTARNAQDIGRNSNFIQSWQQNVMPARMAHAGTAGQGWKTTADLLKLASIVYAPYALGGTPASTAADSGATVGSSAAGQQIQAARWGKDFAGAFGGGGQVPFGSYYGTGLVADPQKSAALAKLASGQPMTEAEYLLTLGM